MKKRAQGNILAISLIIIVLIILIILLLVIFFYPIMSGKSVKASTTTSASLNNLVCNAPYILVGNSCCLDKDANKICDSDEVPATPISTLTVSNTPTPNLNCKYPYMRKGSTCCLDEDNNGICDADEDYHTSDYVTRRANIDDPFHITNIELGNDYVAIELKNTGDQDVIIKKIDIDDCGSENYGRELDEGQRKSFVINCDNNRLKYIDSDFSVRYTDISGNLTQTSEGSMKIDKRVSSSSNNDDYSNDY